jgi:hypothetical protein
VIFDWKTSKNKPPLSVLKEQMQTNLYPFVLNRAGQELFPDLIITPDRIDFIYWYPLSPDHEALIPYSNESDTNFELELEKLTDQILEFEENNQIFPLTTDDKLCEYCPYRSYCERGFETGILADLFDIDQETSKNFYFELDQIGEIEF